MRLVCPNCDAKYEVSDDAVPEEGRDVQCSSCGHAWFQRRPEDEIAAEEEAALFGDDLAAVEMPAPEPVIVDEVQAVPEGTDAAIAAALGAAVAGHALDADPETHEPDAAEQDNLPPTDLPPKRELDDGILAVLREEAEREAQARRAEVRKADAEGQMQFQPDLGMDAAPATAALTPTQRRLAMLKGEDPDAGPPEPLKPAARRDLLPDVEEINSTLSPSDAELNAEVDALPDLTKGRSGFRSGFFLMLLLAVVAAAVYMAAPKLIAQFPALESVLTDYVASVDSLRLWLNDLMKSATSALKGGS